VTHSAETGKAVETIFFSVWIVNKLAVYSKVAAHTRYKRIEWWASLKLNLRLACSLQAMAEQ
jgi:hypothetical protein